MITNTPQEERLRHAVKTLLALRGVSLMRACIEATERAGSKLDYGNASSWLRGVPGRFGMSKVELLLDYLGIKDYRLDTQRIHAWILPHKDDKTGREAMLQLLKEYAGLPARALWLLTPQKALHALAVDAGGVTIIFQPSKDIRRDDLHEWLDTLQKPCDMVNEAVGIKSIPHWDDLFSGREPPERLWQMEQSDDERAWQKVIEVLKARGITPEEVLAWVEQNQPHEDADLDLLDPFCDADDVSLATVFFDEK